MTTAFAPFNQAAAFKTCEIFHFATSKGYVTCGGRIDGQFCEFDHIQNLDVMSEEEYDGLYEYDADAAYERHLESNERYRYEVDEDLRRCGEAGL